MEQKFDEFSLREAMRLAKTPAGQQLMALLQRSCGSELQKAMDRASAGDYAQAQQTISRLLQSPEAQALLKQMKG